MLGTTALLNFQCIKCNLFFCVNPPATEEKSHNNMEFDRQVSKVG